MPFKAVKACEVLHCPEKVKDKSPAVAFRSALPCPSHS